MQSDGGEAVKLTRLRCVNCGARFAMDAQPPCDQCGGVLELDLDSAGARPLLPDSVMREVSLGEGLTPLLQLPKNLLGRTYEGELLAKIETGNPTGSFKDRLCSVAVAHALLTGRRGIICASTGNAGASAAAYAARAGLPSVTCVPETAPPAKLSQALHYGTTLVRVRGTFSDAYRVADELAAACDLSNVSTTYRNPVGVAGLRAVGWELIEAMDAAPDAIFVPTGSGPLVRGIHWAYEDALRLGRVEQLPAMVAVQPAGCAPIVRAFRNNDSTVARWDEPDTIAGGIADPLEGYERDGSYTLRLVRETAGWAAAVDDAELVSAARDLAVHSGVFAELSGAAGLAGAREALRAGRLSDTATVVVMVTGSGFKDLGIRPTPDADTTVHFDPAASSMSELAARIRDAA